MQQAVRRIDAWYHGRGTLTHQVGARLGDIEDLTLIHERQHQRIGNPIVAALPALPFFPVARANHPLCWPGTYQATHGTTPFLLFVTVDRHWRAKFLCCSARVTDSPSPPGAWLTRHMAE